MKKKESEGGFIPQYCAIIKFARGGKGGNAATDKVIADAKRTAAKVAADTNRVLCEKDAELHRLRKQLTQRDEEGLSRER